MTMETAHQSLQGRLAAVRAVLEDLQRIVDDRPATVVPKPIDDFAEAVTDTVNGVVEAQSAGARAVEAMGPPADPERIRRALVDMHSAFNRGVGDFNARVASLTSAEQMTEVTTGLGGQWAVWWIAVNASIEPCTALLQAASNAIIDVWSELAARAGGTSISVNTTTVGNNVRGFPRDEAGTAALAGG